PIRPRLTASRGAVPNTDTVPASGGSRPSSMSMVVDLPAPLGPSSVTVSPDAIEMFTLAHRGYHALPGAERFFQAGQSHPRRPDCGVRCHGRNCAERTRVGCSAGVP